MSLYTGELPAVVDFRTFDCDPGEHTLTIIANSTFGETANYTYTFYAIIPSELPLATIGLYLPIRGNLTISASDKMGAPVETSLQFNLSKCAHVTYYRLYTQPSKCILLHALVAIMVV